MSGSSSCTKSRPYPASPSRSLADNNALLRLFFRYESDRLKVCLSTVHGLLHIAHYLKWMGPPSAYWEFAMERMCGRLRKLVKSRVRPYAGLTRRAAIMEEIHILGDKYVAFLSPSKRCSPIAQILCLVPRREVFSQ